MDIIPKQFVNSDSQLDSFSMSNINELGKDDDDPLSIENASVTIIGIVFAAMTIFLPAVSILLERPFPQTQGGISKQIIEIDGY